MWIVQNTVKLLLDSVYSTHCPFHVFWQLYKDVLNKGKIRGRKVFYLIVLYIVLNKVQESCSTCHTNSNLIIFLWMGYQKKLLSGIRKRPFRTVKRSLLQSYFFNLKWTVMLVFSVHVKSCCTVVSICHGIRSTIFYLNCGN